MIFFGNSIIISKDTVNLRLKKIAHNSTLRERHILIFYMNPASQLPKSLRISPPIEAVLKLSLEAPLEGGLIHKLISFLSIGKQLFSTNQAKRISLPYPKIRFPYVHKTKKVCLK